MTPEEAEAHYLVCEPCCAAARRPWMNHGRIERYDAGCRCAPCKQTWQIVAGLVTHKSSVVR